MPYYPRRKMYKRKARKAYKVAKKSLGKTTARAVKAIVSSQMNKVIETKCADYSYEPVPLSCFYHNVWYPFESDPLSIVQGVQDSMAVNPPNRLGDSIYCKGIQFKVLLTNFSNWPNNQIRIVILRVKSAASAITNPSYHPQIGNNLITPVYMEDGRIKSCVYDKTFSIMSTDGSVSVNGMDKTWLWKHYVKVNRKIKYDEAGAASSSDTYRCYALMYSTQGTFTSTNIGRFSYFRRTYYQDA